MITIRVADIEADALTILHGARDCYRRHKEHQGDLNVGSLFPDDEGLVRALSRLVSCDELEILIAESDGQVVGGAGILYVPYLWNLDLLTGEKLFWWTEETAPFRTAVILVNEVTKRIESKGARPVFRMLKTDPKGVEKLYRRLNMVPVETTYMRLP